MARYSTNVSAFKKRKGIAQSLIGPKRGFGSQSVQGFNTMNGKLGEITGGKMIDRGPKMIDVGPLKPGTISGTGLTPKVQVKPLTQPSFTKPKTTLRGQTVGTAPSMWADAKKKYKGGRWSGAVHADGSQYYRAPSGDLLKVWPNGSSQVKRKSKR